MAICIEKLETNIFFIAYATDLLKYPHVRVGVSSQRPACIINARDSLVQDIVGLAAVCSPSGLNL